MGSTYSTENNVIDQNISTVISTNINDTCKSVTSGKISNISIIADDSTIESGLDITNVVEKEGGCILDNVISNTAQTIASNAQKNAATVTIPPISFHVGNTHVRENNFASTNISTVVKSNASNKCSEVTSGTISNVYIDLLNTKVIDRPISILSNVSSSGTCQVSNAVVNHVSSESFNKQENEVKITGWLGTLLDAIQKLAFIGLIIVIAGIITGAIAVIVKVVVAGEVSVARAKARGKVNVALAEAGLQPQPDPQSTSSRLLDSIDNVANKGFALASQQ